MSDEEEITRVKVKYTCPWMPKTPFAVCILLFSAGLTKKQVKELKGYDDKTIDEAYELAHACIQG